MGEDRHNPTKLLQEDAYLSKLFSSLVTNVSSMLHLNSVFFQKYIFLPNQIVAHLALFLPDPPLFQQWTKRNAELRSADMGLHYLQQKNTVKWMFAM